MILLKNILHVIITYYNHIDGYTDFIILFHALEEKGIFEILMYSDNYEVIYNIYELFFFIKKSIIEEDPEFTHNVYHIELFI